MYSAFGKSLCTYKRCWKWCPRASIQAWTRLIVFANTFCRSAFGKSLCTYKSCWKWCPRASIQAWTRLILFANTFCRCAFGKSLCTYKMCWKWCPRADNTDNQIYVPKPKCTVTFRTHGIINAVYFLRVTCLSGEILSVVLLRGCCTVYAQ
jgi:hypothetical protein